MFSFIFNPKCHKALKDAEDFEGWKKAYNKDAEKACRCFQNYLKHNHYEIHSLRFLTTPAAGYYFMIAYHERELTTIRAIHIERGVIELDPQNSALEHFLRELDILHTSLPALQLAQMTHCFHTQAAYRLVTEHKTPVGARPECEPPKIQREENGSLTLCYDLYFTGRGFTITQCRLTVTPDYQITFECHNKNQADLR